MDESKVLFEVILIIVMFVATFGSLMVPPVLFKLYLKATDEDEKIRYECALSCLSMFVCGNFLGIAFLDMLPDFFTELREALSDTLIKFPVGEFVVVFGLLLMIILDQLLIIIKENQIDSVDLVARLDRPTGTPTETRSMMNHTVTAPSTLMKPSVFHSIVLFLSLMVHSLLEGVVITTQGSSTSDVLLLFIPILLHKVVVAIGLGLSSTQADMKMPLFIFLSLCFSATTPAGMAIGVFLKYFLTFTVLTCVSGILEGVACGTFLYVVCFELIPRELERARYRLLKLTLLISGYSCTVLGIYLVHELGL